MRYQAKIEISTAEGICVHFSSPLFTGDIGNNVELSFFLRGQPYEAANAQVYSKLPNGTAASLSVQMSGNKVAFTIPNNMYQSSGQTELQVALLDTSGNILTSGVLYFDVLEGLSEKTQIAGTDEYNDMNALLYHVSAGLEQIERAESVANVSEGLNSEMQEFLAQYGNVSDQVIANLTEEDLDSFFSGIGLVSSSVPESPGGDTYDILYKWIVISEHENDLAYLTVTQTRFYNGSIQTRKGKGVTSHPLTWTAWSDKGQNTYDVIFDSNTDLSGYHGQTISSKKIFLKENIMADASINITFLDCTLYGNKKTIGTMGLLIFQGCTLYDVNIYPSGIWDPENTIMGDVSLKSCLIYGGSVWSYWDPYFEKCTCFNMKIEGYASGGRLDNSSFKNCTFNLQPSGSTTNMFTECHFESTAGSGLIYGNLMYMGCTGEIVVSSSANIKPSGTTSFSDINYSTLTIQSPW